MKNILYIRMFQGTNVIQLYDQDFQLTSLQPLVKNKLFNGKCGYIMFYSPWCHHCQSKKDFWSYLAKQFNQNPDFRAENFCIAAVNVQDSRAQKIVERLNINTIPRFYHVMPHGQLIEYQNNDLSPRSLLQAVCQRLPGHRLCSFDSNRL